MPLRILCVGVGASASRKPRAQADSLPSGSLYCGVIVVLQIGILLAVVEERIEISGVVRRQRELPAGLCSTVDVGGEGQRVGALIEGRDRDAVAEHVVDPAQRHRLRRDLELGGEHAQIMPVARTQHDPVFAERHGTRIAIFGLVMNRQQRHRQAIIVIPGSLIYSRSLPNSIAMLLE